MWFHFENPVGQITSLLFKYFSHHKFTLNMMCFVCTCVGKCGDAIAVAIFICNASELF